MKIKFLKRYFSVFAVLFFVLTFGVGSASAENWTLTGSNIYSNNSGNVGIGTTNPLDKLEVFSSSMTKARLTSTDSTAYTSWNFFEDLMGTYTRKAAIQAIGSSFGTVDRRNDLELFSDSGDVTFWPGATQRVTFKSGGKVGLGTATPSYDLSLGGTSAKTIGMERSTSGAGNDLTIQAGGAATGSPDVNGGALHLSSGISTDYYGNSYINFLVSRETSDNPPLGGIGSGADNPFYEAMRITGDGLVGIGTTSPTALLDVSGNIHSTGSITGNGFSTNGTAGIYKTISIRKGDNSGACSLTITGGLITATSC